MARKRCIFMFYAHLNCFYKIKMVHLPFKVKSCLWYKLGRLCLSFFAINYFLRGMCLFGRVRGVSSYAHTVRAVDRLGELSSFTGNILHALTTVNYAHGTTSTCGLWSADKKHKHGRKGISSIEGVIGCFRGASIRRPSAESSSICTIMSRFTL